MMRHDWDAKRKSGHASHTAVAYPNRGLRNQSLSKGNEYPVYSPRRRITLVSIVLNVCRLIIGGVWRTVNGEFQD